MYLVRYWTHAAKFSTHGIFRLLTKVNFTLYPLIQPVEIISLKVQNEVRTKQDSVLVLYNKIPYRLKVLQHVLVVHRNAATVGHVGVQIWVFV